jgi:hypothetical protein
MYAYRVMMTEQGSLEDPENSLKYPLARGLSVFKRFFSIDSNTYSTPVFMEGHKGILNYIYPVLFLCGFLSFLRKFVRSRGKAILMLIFPLAYIVVFVTMLSWMKVGWHRYYTLVSLSVLIMQVEGIMNVYHMIQNMSTNVINTLRSN